MEKILTYAMDIGECMLTSGGEVHRVEASVQRICTALGAARTDVFIITSSMVVTVFDVDGRSYTQTRRITASGTDYERLHRLNDLSRRICAGKLGVDGIAAALESAVNAPVYPLWLECICYSVIAGAFTLFFGGGLTEMTVSLTAGLAVRLLMILSEKAVPSKIFSKFTSAVTATLVSLIAVKLGIVSSVDKIIIGNIMTLIPGIGLTNALRDLFTGDSIAGLLRSIEAVLTALAIAAGYFLVAIPGGLVL